MSEKVTAIFFLLVVCGGFYLLTSLVSWLTGSRIKSRYGGVELGSPDTIPAIFNFFSNSPKGIYKKIQSKISAEKFHTLNSTTDKIQLLQQLGELKEKGIITDLEFDTLKNDLL